MTFITSYTLMTSPETQVIDVSVKETPNSRKRRIKQGRRKTNVMEYLFEIRNLSEEPTIRLRQLWDLQAQYAQEARGKVYHEIKIQKNRGISFDEYVAGFGLDNYYTMCRLELEQYLKTECVDMLTGKEYTTRIKFDHHLSHSGLKIDPVFVDTKPSSRFSSGHVLPQPPCPIRPSSDESSLSFEDLMLGYYPHITIREALGYPLKSTSVPVLELDKYKPKKEETRVLENGSPLAEYRANDDRENYIASKNTKLSVMNQSSAAGDQNGNIRMKINDVVSDVKQTAIFDPILAMGDNSVTAARVSKKQSVAARMGKWLRRLFSCTKKLQLID